MKAYLVIVLEDKDKVQHQLINHHQPSSIIINHHQWPSMMINEHQWSSIIINDHQWSSIKEWIFTTFLIFRSLRRRTGVNCHFFTKVGKLLTLAPDVRLRFLKKGKWSELNFRNFWPGFRHLRPNTNTQIRKDKYTITRITPFWNEVSYFPKQFILTNRWHTVHFQCSAVLWTSSSSPSSPSSSPSPSSWFHLWSELRWGRRRWNSTSSTVHTAPW